MQAVRFSEFGGPEVLELVEIPEPHAGAGEIRIAVRAVGLGGTDLKERAGGHGGDLPHTTGREAAGVVDEVGHGVTDVAVGDRVFGVSGTGAAAAEFAVLAAWAPIADTLGFVDTAVLPVAVETATRALDRLGVTAVTTVLVNGASGGVGSAAVQLAVARGARVIGTAGRDNHTYLSGLGVEPVVYGDGLTDRVRALAPDGVDLALDVVGSGVLPELIDLAGGAGHVVTLADPRAQELGVHFSTGEDGRTLHALTTIGALIEAGRFWLPVAQTFPLAEIVRAHRVGEAGHLRGRLALLVD